MKSIIPHEFPRVMLFSHDVGRVRAMHGERLRISGELFVANLLLCDNATNSSASIEAQQQAPNIDFSFSLVQYRPMTFQVSKQSTIYELFKFSSSHYQLWKTFLSESCRNNLLRIFNEQKSRMMSVVRTSWTLRLASKTKKNLLTAFCSFQFDSFFVDDGGRERWCCSVFASFLEALLVECPTEWSCRC